MRIWGNRICKLVVLICAFSVCSKTIAEDQGLVERLFSSALAGGTTCVVVNLYDSVRTLSESVRLLWPWPKMD